MNANRHRISNATANHPTRGWMDEHAATVHRICQGIERRRERGGKATTRLIIQAARRWNGKPFKCDRSRTFKLSAHSLRRLYYTWRRKGQVPAAIRLRFAGHNKGLLPAPVLCRFVQFCGNTPLPSQKAALTAFTTRSRSKTSKATISLATVQRYFPGAAFHALQSTIKAEADAKHERAVLLAENIAAIRRRLPDRPTRHRRTLPEISLDSAQL